MDVSQIPSWCAGRPPECEQCAPYAACIPYAHCASSSTDPNCVHAPSNCDAAPASCHSGGVCVDWYPCFRGSWIATCTNLDFIRVSPGCGVEVATAAQGGGSQHHFYGDAFVGVTPGYDTVRSIRLFAIPPAPPVQYCTFLNSPGGWCLGGPDTSMRRADGSEAASLDECWQLCAARYYTCLLYTSPSPRDS